ncbi:MAG: hypothetical protein ACTSPY_17170 [Candidatus Helarchaeota archaeon]
MDDFDFDLEISLGPVSGYWNWLHRIPPFKNRNGLKDWDERLKEELEKIEILKKFGKEKIFFEDIILDQKNKRVFHCLSNIKGRKIDIPIRIPVRYPKEPPVADFAVGPYSFPSGTVRSACLGKIYSKWAKDGSMGIAHFVGMLGSYISLTLFSQPLRKKRKK